jgi:ATP-dependent Clp protease protease subunit
MTDNPSTRLDDDLARRLLDQRTIVLGSVLDETLGNRLCSAL